MCDVNMSYGIGTREGNNCLGASNGCSFDGVNGKELFDVRKALDSRLHWGIGVLDCLFKWIVWAIVLNLWET